MAILSDLVEELKTLAGINADDDGEAFSDDNLSVYLTQALRQHNSQYTFDTLPELEEEPVLTLAWVKVCLIRAAKAAKDGNVSGAHGYGRDVDSPYSKQMSLAKTLSQRYQDLCSRLTNSTPGVIVSSLFVRDNVTDALFPLLESAGKPMMILSTKDTILNVDTSVVLRWTISDISDFYEVIVFNINGDDPIYEEWNSASATGIPSINDAAHRLFSTRDNTIRALKVTDLDRDNASRFIIVLRTRSEKYSYSNEFIVPDDTVPEVPPIIPPTPVNTNMYRYVGDTAEGHVTGNEGDIVVLLPSKVIQIKSLGSGNSNTTGWE